MMIIHAGRNLEQEGNEPDSINYYGSGQEDRRILAAAVLTHFRRVGLKIL